MQRYTIILLPFIGLHLMLAGCEELAPYQEKIEPIVEKSKPILEEVKSAIKKNTGVSEPQISSMQMVTAIKQALSQGVDDSVYLLGSLEGFNLSNKYRIGMPQELDKPASLLRKLGQGRKVDDFETRLNRAAKQAVKQATPVFTSAIENMSIEDALTIMQGQDDAATTYFRSRTETALRDRFMPIISDATGKTGLTSAYKSLSKMINTMDPGNQYTVDIDHYVLDRSMDALFDRIAIEEKLIREQPLKRSTELMQTVYGYFDR